MNKRVSALLMSLALASLAGLAIAQQTGQQGPVPGTSIPMGPGMKPSMPMMSGRGMGMGMMGGCSSGGGMGPGMMGVPAQHIEGWIAFLRTELKITDAQTPLFNTFADTLRAAAKSLQSLHNQMRSGERPDTWPERLTRHEQMMTAHLEALKKVKGAAIPLYNALSADQKQTADSLPMGMGIGMGMMGR